MSLSPFATAAALPVSSETITEVPWMLNLYGWAGAAIVMAVLWAATAKNGKSDLVDAAWALGIGILAISYGIVSDGEPLRRALVAGLASIWGLRLGGHILHRVMTSPKDGRYETLEEWFGSRKQLGMFLFFQLQAFWAALFAFPMTIACANPSGFGTWDVVAALIWVTSLVGEAIADAQLGRFRRRSDTKGRVCRTGLWKYSRHPNYFFEWIHWWAYVSFSVGSSIFAWSLVGPISMYVFLTKLTGIPPTEKQSVKSRGDAYREYQRTTSPFFPWPPKPYDEERAGLSSPESQDA